MADKVYVVLDWLGLESWPVAVFTEREFAQEHADSRDGTIAEVDLHRGRGTVTQSAHNVLKRAIATGIVLLTSVVAAGAQTYPAGSTIFAVDVVAVGPVVATEFNLELDGQLQPPAPAGAFTTGEFRFPPVTVTGGIHTARARACTDWGADFGGTLCSSWTAPLTFTALVSGAPNVPDGFRIDQIMIVVGPQP